DPHVSAPGHEPEARHREEQDRPGTGEGGPLVAEQREFDDVEAQDRHSQRRVGQERRSILDPLDVPTDGAHWPKRKWVAVRSHHPACRPGSSLGLIAADDLAATEMKLTVEGTGSSPGRTRRSSTVDSGGDAGLTVRGKPGAAVCRGDFIGRGAFSGLL